MHPQQIVGGDGTSAPLFHSSMGSIPNLVAWPLYGPAFGMTPENIQQIYCLAYELAQAALRPSAYDLAQRAYAN
jgi:hypothetical protein